MCAKCLLEAFKAVGSIMLLITAIGLVVWALLMLGISIFGEKSYLIILPNVLLVLTIPIVIVYQNCHAECSNRKENE